MSSFHYRFLITEHKLINTVGKLRQRAFSYEQLIL